MQVQKVLNPKLGGSLTASIEEVVARLSRAKVRIFQGTRRSLLVENCFPFVTSLPYLLLVP